MSWTDNETPPRASAISFKEPLPHRTNLPHLREPHHSSSQEPTQTEMEGTGEASKISAYARLDFDQYTFFVQTLQVVLGRKSPQEFLLSSHHTVDVHLSSKKAISRRHAKIFYNFGTQRFEISVLGRNGAFVDDLFIAKGITVPLLDSTKIQIGDIPFTFVLPSIDANEAGDVRGTPSQSFNPADALNLRSNLYLSLGSPKRSSKSSKADSEPVKKESASMRRNSKAEIVRKLSLARRKLLASSSNDEISALLKELEVFHGGSELILEETESPFDPALLDDDVDDLLRTSRTMSQSELEKAEDEIDELVKQHNMSEGVVLTNTTSGSSENGTLPTSDNFQSKLPKDLAMEINILDQEVANLAPLIDAQTGAQQGVKQENDDLEKGQFPGNLGAYNVGKSGILKTNSLHFDPADTLRLAQMGKSPVGPRMGKPATIQPPSNKLYGRPPVGQIGQIGQNGQIGPVSSAVSPGTLPTGIHGQPNYLNHLNHLGSQMGHNLPIAGLNSLGQISTPHPSGYAVTAAPGYSPYAGYASTQYNPMQRPPPPKLEVEVELITSIPAVNPRAPFRPITVSTGKVEKAPVCAYKSLQPPKTKPRSSARRRDSGPRRPPKVQNPKDIPEQFKTKPAVSILAMISAVLRNTSAEKKGFTINEIHESIKEIFPYYKYCPDGWQFPVTHNLKYNKTFTAVHKPDFISDWLWAIDHAYLEDKEKFRKIQQEMAMAKAKEAALRAADYRQRQNLPHMQNMQSVAGVGMPNPNMLMPGQTIAGLQSALGYNLGRPFVPTDASQPARFPSLTTPQSSSTGLQRPKSIAEIASEIKREGPHSFNKAPAYFPRKPELKTPDLGGFSTDAEKYQATIKDQLAANRARVSSSLGNPNPLPQLGKPPSSAIGGFRPQVSRPGSFQNPLLGVTQNQRPNAGPNMSAPKPVLASKPALDRTGSLMLKPASDYASKPAASTPASAVNAANAGVASSSSAASPAKTGSLQQTAMNVDTKKSLTYLQKELFTLYKARNLNYNTTVTTEIITKALATTIAQVNSIGAKAGCGDNALSFLVEKAPQQVSKILDLALTRLIKEKQGAVSGQTSRAQTPQPQAQPQTAAKGPLKSGEAPAPLLHSTQHVPPKPSNLSTPLSSSPGAAPNRAQYAGLSKPQSFTKPSALGKPPQFVSNKPRVLEKRPSDEGVPEAKKVTKIDE